ncbi:MAG: glycoside hydrolase family 2 protein, partial [Anaerolineae bacterium]
VPEPQLWWPWDHGRPDLYRLQVEVRDGRQVLDTTGQAVGLRQVELDGWTLRINDRPVYARGANWVPADILPGRVSEADYHDLLSLARQANMNMLRVWGGGLREKQAFYDLCDRLGILVWQEFPFACAFLTRFPRSEPYLRLVEAEAGSIVRTLRNHASLALWCGGNEFDPGRNEPLVSALRRVVEEEDPTRPFLPASPANGDSHNWRVWHNFEPPSAYRRDSTSFASEFGLQATPSTEALKRFVPGNELWPPGPSWTYHGADLNKLRRYARPFLGEGAHSLEPFVQASQRAQAQGLKIGIEHYRRRKAQGCGGVLLWQLNEPWPAISWAIVDYDREPKPAYEMVKRLLTPVLVSVDLPPQRYGPGDQVQASVWVVNDLASALPEAQVQVVLRDGSGAQVQLLAQTVAVAAHSAEVVGWIDGPLSAEGGWRLECQLAQGVEVLSRNEYDLSIHDGIRPAIRQRLWHWITGLVMPS